MLIEVLTPSKTLYDGEVEIAEFPGKSGRFQVLDQHAPLMSLLGEGDIVLNDTSKNIQKFSILNGYIEVKENKIVVLVNSAE